MTDPDTPDTPDAPKRQGRGEQKTSIRRVDVAVRRGKALQMRAAGLTFEQIKDQLGYKTRGSAVQDVQRAMALTVSEPAADLRALQAARLEMLWVKAMQVLSRTHLTVSHGRVIMVGPEGAERPLQDDGPVLAAIRELRQISTEVRKLFGLDAPTRVEVISDDTLDAEIRRLSEELDRAASAQAPGTATPQG